MHSVVRKIELKKLCINLHALMQFLSNFSVCVLIHKKKSFTYEIKKEEKDDFGTSIWQ